MVDALGEVFAQVDAFFVHGPDRVGRHRVGRKHARRGRHHAVRAKRARETFRHLAAAGVADTDEQNALLVPLVHSFSRKIIAAPEKSSLLPKNHSFSRNSLCTRESVVSSGWNVATRCGPCSISTAWPS